MSNRLSDELLDAPRAAVPPGSVITTLAEGRPNKVVDIGREGVRVSTEKSESSGSGPQLVDAEMLEVAWQQLQATGSLSAAELQATGGLNVKRSSAVCALLARLPGVTVASTRPIRLSWQVR